MMRIISTARHIDDSDSIQFLHSLMRSENDDSGEL